ncbi:hypothetical protein BJ165DRAFT_1530377 [Panaeolus papilionaceus]|nr:hypothetical protein BJ165DRAFT_1530377 [Panaeolus papilionaceus]
MDGANTERFEYLDVGGEITVIPFTEKISEPKSTKYLFMGPTGAGKSSFIEALAGGPQVLAISKNQLSSYTQKVNTYQLVNVSRWGRRPTYLIDTPGFSDNKLSEIEIMKMITSWLKENNEEYFSVIFYLIPINDTRLGGSKRRTIRMLKEFLTPIRELGTLCFVTTMWDTLHNEQMYLRAEARLAQLQGEILKEFIDHRAEITRFTNTRSSALSILDQRQKTNMSFTEVDLKLTPLLLHDLHDRISISINTIQVLESDLSQAETQENLELKSILEGRQSETKESLIRFITQICEFLGPEHKANVDLQQLCRAIMAADIDLDDTHKRQIELWARDMGKAGQGDDLVIPTDGKSGVVPESDEPEKSIGLSAPHLIQASGTVNVFQPLVDAVKRKGKKIFNSKRSG